MDIRFYFLIPIYINICVHARKPGPGPSGQRHIHSRMKFPPDDD